jgi:hypothetical protein
MANVILTFHNARIPTQVDAQLVLCAILVLAPCVRMVLADLILLVAQFQHVLLLLHSNATMATVLNRQLPACKPMDVLGTRQPVVLLMADVL